MERALKIYNSLPGPARSIVASMQGWRLRSWRYGPETEQLVAEALERDYWSAEQWKSWQENRLGFILHRAATKVPYYRKQWRERRRRGDHSSFEYLENWPILEKESVRESPRAFLADDCAIRSMQHVHTSGTTGKSLDLWRSRETERAWYALFEARCRKWHGLSRHERWAILGGRLVTPVTQRRPPFWVWNASLNQLYLSSYHLSPDYIPYYLEALKHYGIVYLFGYTSALYELAHEILERDRRDLKMQVAITNAEPVFDYQRLAIAAAFQCPVRETYGMAEIVCGASECEQGSLHLWPEVSSIEVMNNGAGKSTAGDLLCSGLVNSDMPLVRYRVGDRVTLLEQDSRCRCGRKLPHLASVDGRLDDLLFTRDGRRIGRLDPVFKGGLPVREAQIIQESLDNVRVRYIPTSGFTDEAAASIIKRLQARMGPVQVTLERVNEMPRTVNGKFRGVICNLPVELKERLKGTAHEIRRVN